MTVLANLLRREPRDVATVRRTAEARAALARAVAMAAHPRPCVGCESTNGRTSDEREGDMQDTGGG